MVRQLGLPVIAKLRHNAALSFPYDGPYGGWGKRRKDGKQLDCRTIPQEYLQESFVETEIQTQISQMHLGHKTCADV